jgi:predicted porin
MTACSVRLAAVATLFAAVASAQQSTPVEVHGFGSWNFGSTSANEYLGGTKKGSSATSQLNLNISSAMSERLTISSQLEMDFNGATNATETSLDYVFAEWKFTDAVRLRAGQVKQPFGIYTEILDVGTVRPFLKAPQAMYGLNGMIGEAYRGLGLTGTRALGRWGVEYDVYTGGLNRFENEMPTDLYRVMNGTSPDTLGIEAIGSEVTDRLYGGRLWLLTPVNGMRVGVSRYRGETSEENEPLSTIDAQALSVELALSRMTTRAEYMYQWENDNDNQTAWYVESAVRVVGNWELAGLYNRYSADLDGDEYESVVSLLRHKEVAVGLNYRFSPNFVMKLAHHNVTGNRFATPSSETLIDDLRASKPLETTTRALILGAQMSF